MGLLEQMLFKRLSNSDIRCFLMIPCSHSSVFVPVRTHLMGICLFKGLCKDGAVQVALLGAEAVVDVGLLHPPDPTSAAPTPPAWPALCAADMLWEGWRVMDDWRTGSLLRSLLQNPGPCARGACQCQAALSLFCVLLLETQPISVSLWEERSWAGWLARSLPLGSVHTRLPPAYVLGVNAASFTPVISVVLPWAVPDALGELKIWMSAHTPPRVSGV